VYSLLCLVGQIIEKRILLLEYGHSSVCLVGGPKSWMQGKTLPSQIVDIYGYGLLQLIDSIAKHYVWGLKEYITLWRELDTDSI
jgi:hypothetical protein